MTVKASWLNNHLTELIQPPSLRAPEVILRANWSTSADIWSAACVVSSSIVNTGLWFNSNFEQIDFWAITRQSAIQRSAGPEWCMDGGRRSFDSNDGAFRSSSHRFASWRKIFRLVFRQRRYAATSSLIPEWLRWFSCYRNSCSSGNMLHIHQIYPSSLERVINFRRNQTLSDDEVPKIKSFLQSMLQYRPENRKSAGEAAMDSWLQS